MASSPTIKLNSGYDMPQVGFGLWKVDNAVCADTVYNAIKAGYRLFDGACDYGNEKECGEGVARAIKDGLVKREDLFIVSKLWQTFHDEDKVEPITRRQLADWQIDYFDLFLSVYDALIYARIKPATLQIEHHPYLQQPDLVSLAQTEGIVVTAYSSFGPTGFMELDMPRAKSVAPLMDSPVIKTIADKHGRTPAQVLLRWATQRGIAVIPKTSRPEVMTQNLDSTTFDLDSEDLAKIADMDLNIRFNKPTNYFSANKLYLFG
ncbi:NAD(P)H-dependent D-xylose reductase xyl1 [Trichoderma longibrachiatum ATCC 18648]|uniref:NAD(P)H-dependent D-xylose reductase xyl1 n=1 Tax=Trichoderma longibrachiatum ATCC 18648 TaxID=983965 RepID=A0A2T4BXN7_TRILO|nr:NAD(P)H-dependent D-xylose reductase xyl1 [Trichoderma longibrachiatum ATCC 18648]